MSIRNFSKTPCPQCKEDTLHLALACQVCGYITQTPGEQWNKRQQLRYLRRVGSGMSPMSVHSYRKPHAKALKEKYAALPADCLSGGKK